MPGYQDGNRNMQRLTHFKRLCSNYIKGILFPSTTSRSTSSPKRTYIRIYVLLVFQTAAMLCSNDAIVCSQSNVSPNWTQQSHMQILESRVQTARLLDRSVDSFVDAVSVNGGYVYHYELDAAGSIARRWGEGEATDAQIWVQPPGTPTVGMALLRAYRTSGNKKHLEYAKNAGYALIDGQLKSGGWTSAIDFDLSGTRVAGYLNRPGRRRDYSTLDDGTSQAAILLLMKLDQVLQFKDDRIHRSVMIALEALLDAQFPGGSFPQVWNSLVEKRPKVQVASSNASYPSQSWNNVQRIKNYWDMPTLNDNVAGDVADVLIEADQIYKHPHYDSPTEQSPDRYRDALKRLGQFLVRAQLPAPQSGWAQQYDTKMHPIWARAFEPPAASSDETQEVISTLLRISSHLGDAQYLGPIEPAVEWLRSSRLPDGKLARFYELRTNRPMYMKRRGRNYSVTFDDSNLPSHYAWKITDKTEQLESQLRRVQRGLSLSKKPSAAGIQTKATEAIEAIDDQGRWVSTYHGERLVGQPKMTEGTRYLSSKVFSRNTHALCDHLDQLNN